MNASSSTVLAVAPLALLWITLGASPAFAQSLQSRALSQVSQASQASQGVADQPLEAQGRQFNNPVIGLPLSERTRLIYEPKPVRPWADNNGLTQQRSEQRVGLEIRNRSGTRELRNLLRVQLTSDSTLQFKPRSGGMAVSWRSEF